MPAKLKSRRVLLIGAAALVVIFAVAYFALFDTQSPPEFSLETRGSTDAQAPPTGELAGIWTVADGSIAGYRVREKLAALPAPSDAVGRTGAITGQVTIAQRSGDFTVDDAAFTVDVSQLKSDDDRRDNKIRTLGLETDRYPEAKFVAAAPIRIPAEAVAGETITIPVDGDLTLHGVTKKVSIPLQVQRDGAQIRLVGSYEFGWADFGMTAPSVPPFVSVTGNPKLEFDLRLSKQT